MVLLDLAWQRVFEPLDAQCAGLVAATLEPDGTDDPATGLPTTATAATSLAVPRLGFGLRDAQGRSVSLSCGDTISTTAAAAAAPAVVDDASDASNRSFVTTTTEACEYQLTASLLATPPPPIDGVDCSATLTGGLVVGAGSAGVAAFEGLVLQSSNPGGTTDDGIGGLCVGDYAVAVVATRVGATAATAAEAGGSEETEAAATTALLRAVVTVRVVSAALAPPTATAWSVVMPDFYAYNGSAATVTRATLSYSQRSSRHAIRTVVATNTTTWLRNVSTATGTSASASSVATADATADFDAEAATKEEELLSVEYVEEVSVRTPTHVLALATKPPTALRPHVPYNVSLLLVTESGIALPAEQVQAVLLGGAGSGARLKSEGSTGYTDARGAVTLTLTIEGGVGRGAPYLLLFGYGGTLEHDLKRDTGMLIDALQRSLGLWHSLAVPLARNLGRAVEAAQSGALRDVLVRRTEAALRREFAAVAEEAQSCVDLYGYLENQTRTNQTLEVDVGFDGLQDGGGGGGGGGNGDGGTGGTGGDGGGGGDGDDGGGLSLEEYLAAVGIEDVDSSLFDALASETPSALACYENALLAASLAPQVVMPLCKTCTRFT